MGGVDSAEVILQPPGSPCTVHGNDPVRRRRMLHDGGMPRARERNLRRVPLGKKRVGPVRAARLMHILVLSKTHFKERLIAGGRRALWRADGG